MTVCSNIDDKLFTLSPDGSYYYFANYNGDSKKVVIPSEYNKLPVTCIGDFAFLNYSSLESIVIPKSVISIGEGAFYNNNLTVYCEAETQPIGWSEEWSLETTPVVWGYDNKIRLSISQPNFIIFFHI